MIYVYTFLVLFGTRTWYVCIWIYTYIYIYTQTCRSYSRCINAHMDNGSRNLGSLQPLTTAEMFLQVLQFQKTAILCSQGDLGQTFCFCDIGSYKDPADSIPVGTVLPCLACESVIPGSTTLYPNSRYSHECVCPTGRLETKIFWPWGVGADEKYDEIHMF